MNGYFLEGFYSKVKITVLDMFPMNLSVFQKVNNSSKMYLKVIVILFIFSANSDSFDVRLAFIAISIRI